MYNEALNINDYKEGEISRKAWEVNKTIETLNAFKAVNTNAEILGVGAGFEPTIYILSNKVKRVWATDKYGDAGAWSKEAPKEMLTTPEKYAPKDVDFDLKHIVVQHMDAKSLNFPDRTFDAIFSCGSIEHFGEWDEILQAMKEIHRVLKDDGIVSLTTEFKLGGRGDGWQGTKLFDEARLKWLISEAGFEPVDNPEYKFPVNQDTLDTVIDIVERLKNMPPVEGVLSYSGFTFTSVHLALRKKRDALTSTKTTKNGGNGKTKTEPIITEVESDDIHTTK